MRTLILSDLHLGTKASQGNTLLEDLGRIASRFDRVILNGDSLDRYEVEECDDEFESLRAVLMDRLQSRSGAPEFLAGNHDPAISAKQWEYLPQSATLIFHGDCLVDVSPPVKVTDKVLSARFNERWKQLGGRPREFVKLIAEIRAVQAQFLREFPPIRPSRTWRQYVSHAVFPPTKPFHVARYWWNVPSIAAKLAATFPQPVRNVIVGHTHFSGRWSVGKITVYNTGSFMPMSIPRAILADGAELKFVPVSELLRGTQPVVVPATGVSE